MTAHTAREKWQSMKRGFAGRCPACGEGRIFHAYLKVSDACPACGEELSHHRADDAPPYFTIFITAHVVGAGILFVEERDYFWPLWLHSLVWPALTIALSLWLLPRVKGALIGLQWALRMHGFDKAEAAPATLPPQSVPSPP